MEATMCSADGCSKAAAARRMCQSHYQRWRRERADPCEVQDCDRRAGTRGLCDAHYSRLLRHGDVDVVAKPGRKKQPARPCSIDGCDLRHKAQGYCSMHYQRLLRKSDPGPAATIRESFMDGVLSRLDVGHPLGCWIWTSTRSADGYGRARSVTEGWKPVHRLVFEYLRGPVAHDMTLDHLCRNRLCANPDHLEVVTMRTNVLRGYGPSAANARKTHCLRGHPLFGENLRINSQKRRVCRTCEQARRAA